MKRFALLLAGVAPLLCASPACEAQQPDQAGNIHSAVPETPDPEARYLIYLHGRIVEVEGRRAVSDDYGPYDYDGILEAFADQGFEVISELRAPDTSASYATRVAQQVEKLTRSGVAAERITMVGFSKGGWLTVLAAAELARDDVSFVVMAGCSPRLQETAAGLRGRMLSLYDSVDRFRPSCRELFAAAGALGDTDEVVLESGLGHGLFYRPRDSWVPLVALWARGEGVGE